MTKLSAPAAFLYAMLVTDWPLLSAWLSTEKALKTGITPSALVTPSLDELAALSLIIASVSALELTTWMNANFRPALSCEPVTVS